MDIITVWGIIGLISYFCLAIKDFKKSDWGIKKEFLHSENRIKWQKRNAVLELGISLFGLLSMWAYYIIKMSAAFLVFGAITLLIFFLSLLNEKTMKRQ